jgi:hypothetical protein
MRTIELKFYVYGNRFYINVFVEHELQSWYLDLRDWRPLQLTQIHLEILQHPLRRNIFRLEYYVIFRGCLGEQYKIRIENKVSKPRNKSRQQSKPNPTSAE